MKIDQIPESSIITKAAINCGPRLSSTSLSDIVLNIDNRVTATNDSDTVQFLSRDSYQIFYVEGCN